MGLQFLYNGGYIKQGTTKSNRKTGFDIHNLLSASSLPQSRTNCKYKFTCFVFY